MMNISWCEMILTELLQKDHRDIYLLCIEVDSLIRKSIFTLTENGCEGNLALFYWDWLEHTALPVKHNRENFFRFRFWWVWINLYYDTIEPSFTHHLCFAANILTISTFYRSHLKPRLHQTSATTESPFLTSGMSSMVLCVAQQRHRRW